MKRYFAAALAFAALAGCGQKGPLYLPDRDTGTVITRPAGTQSPETAPQPSTRDPNAEETQRKEEDSSSPR